MSNHLSNENSPYLLQHAGNPVDWYPWGEEALEKAQREDKPVFLSIGYAACHWCHVMAHESFENPETAAIMNQNYVNIKVDREERPDLDNIYMNAVVAMTGQGGWPMSIFLTPDGKPFTGGTYFPPVRRYNMPSFREVLLYVKQQWDNEREKIYQSAEQVTQHISPEINLAASSQTLQRDLLEQAKSALANTYDWQDGGWGQAPRFPQPMSIEFLLRLASQGDTSSLEMATHALIEMAKGGMYDVVGGGFSRYSTDNHWLIPHFEKMLYDNAQLARVYLHAYLLTKDEYFRRICEETLDFITRELTNTEGGFYSSLDADSEGVEGKYYIWTPQEFRLALEKPEDIELILAAYNITEKGNFEGANVLQQAMSDDELAERFNLPIEQVPLRLAELHTKLLKYRENRVRPGTDDKVLTAWNALALVAFSEAGKYLEHRDYTELAMRNGRFLLDNLHRNGQLYRSWRSGQARHNAALEDYASLILGLLALYQTDPQQAWYSSAVELLNEMLDHYRDPQGGFYDTRDDQDLLITRPKDVQDNATPSGNSLAAMALLNLSAYSDRGDWRDLAEQMISGVMPAAVRYPVAFGNWLCAADFALSPVQQVAVLGNPGNSNTQALLATLWSEFRPNLVAAASDLPLPPGSPPLLADRPLLNGLPTAYVCENFICHRPVNYPQELSEQLNKAPQE